MNRSGSLSCVAFNKRVKRWQNFEETELRQALNSVDSFCRGISHPCREATLIQFLVWEISCFRPISIVATPCAVLPSGTLTPSVQQTVLVTRLASRCQPCPRHLFSSAYTLGEYFAGYGTVVVLGVITTTPSPFRFHIMHACMHDQTVQLICPSMVRALLNVRGEISRLITGAAVKQSGSYGRPTLEKISSSDPRLSLYFNTFKANFTKL